MTINEIKRLLADRNLVAVAKNAEINYFSLARFVRGDAKRVDMTMIERLQNYLKQAA